MTDALHCAAWGLPAWRFFVDLAGLSLGLVAVCLAGYSAWRWALVERY